MGWSLHETNEIVGFQHGLEKSSQWDSEDTRIPFLTEGIIMRQAMKIPDVNSHFSVIDGCVVLMLDDVHSGSSDVELILARVLPMDTSGRHQELIIVLPPMPQR